MGSLNYAWFNQRFEAFIYVDRIAVSSQHRRKGIGSILYERVIAHAENNEVPVAAEVNRQPPIPAQCGFMTGSISSKSVFCITARNP